MISQLSQVYCSCACLLARDTDFDQNLYTGEGMRSQASGAVQPFKLMGSADPLQTEATNIFDQGVAAPRSNDKKIVGARLRLAFTKGIGRPLPEVSFRVHRKFTKGSLGSKRPGK